MSESQATPAWGLPRFDQNVVRAHAGKPGIAEGAPSPNEILVTGGAGYIGSHTVLELLDAGYATLSLRTISSTANPRSGPLYRSLASKPFGFVE
jgi:hypothetical protein